MSQLASFTRRATAVGALAALALCVACGDSGGGTSAPATPSTPTTAATPSQPAAPSQPAQPTTTPAAPATAAAPAAAGDASKGAAHYAIYCASCHGPKGCGDGPLSATLNPKPAKHCDGNLMNPLSDDFLFKVVKQGGASVGKSPLMAPWGGTLSDAQIRDVIAFVRTLADPPYRPKS